MILNSKLAVSFTLRKFAENFKITEFSQNYDDSVKLIFFEHIHQKLWWFSEQKLKFRLSSIIFWVIFMSELNFYFITRYIIIFWVEWDNVVLIILIFILIRIILTARFRIFFFRNVKKTTSESDSVQLKISKFKAHFIFLDFLSTDQEMHTSCFTLKQFNSHIIFYLRHDADGKNAKYQFGSFQHQKWFQSTSIWCIQKETWRTF